MFVAGSVVLFEERDQILEKLTERRHGGKAGPDRNADLRPPGASIRCQFPQRVTAATGQAIEIAVRSGGPAAYGSGLETRRCGVPHGLEC